MAITLKEFLEKTNIPLFEDNGDGTYFLNVWEDCDHEDDDCDCVECEVDEETGVPFFFEFEEETLVERKIHVRVTSKGKRIRKIKCPKGRVTKNIRGRKVCVVPSGQQKQTKRRAIRKSVRTKKAKGSGYKQRSQRKRLRALKRRKSMGLK